MSSRDAFRKTMALAGAARPVFVPCVYGLAARIDQTPLMDAVGDATAYAAILEGAWKLLRQDAVVLSWDATIEAEAFGALVDWPGDFAAPVISGWTEADFSAASPENNWRFTVQLEAARRLIQTRGREVAVLGVVTGPVSLAALLREGKPERAYSSGELVAAAGGYLKKCARSFGEVKVDALVVREDLRGEAFAAELVAGEKAFRDVYATLFNLTQFYNQGALLAIKGGALDDLARVVEAVRPGGLLLSGRDCDDAGLDRLADLAAARKLAVGLPLPVAEPDRAGETLRRCERFLARRPAPGFFYTSDGEVPPDVPLEHLRDLMDRIKGVTNQSA